MTNALSHERLTPLNSVVNMSEMIIHDLGDQPDELACLEEQKLQPVKKDFNGNFSNRSIDQYD